MTLIASTSMKMTAIILSIKALEMNSKNMNILVEWKIIKANSMAANFLVQIDWMSIMFMSTIIMISGVILDYSMSYIKIHKSRFMMIMGVFMTSMILLVISPTPLSIILGWDGLGLSSFCLVAFFQSSSNSLESAMITIMFNRIGDVAILACMFMMASNSSWNSAAQKLSINAIFVLVIASMTKSAQIPFSSWLPKAMAAPTPVSALVHSSTLVTAGVYMLIRFPKISEEMSSVIKWISLATIMTAGISTMSENDIKKVIALSTLSQMGFMMTAISFKLNNQAFLHMICHALFKSLMFMCAGIIIHMSSNSQDLRMMGSIKSPMTSASMSLSASSMVGMPFLTGFFSKDSIVEKLLQSKWSWAELAIFIMGMSFTTAYSSKIMSSVMWSPPSFPPLNKQAEKDMIVPLAALNILAVIGGAMMFKSLQNMESWTPTNMKLKLVFSAFSFSGMMINLISKSEKCNKTSIMMMMDSISPKFKNMNKSIISINTPIEKIWIEMMISEKILSLVYAYTNTSWKSSLHKISMTLIIIIIIL